MDNYRTEAKIIANAIRAFNNNLDALDNFESYLAIHFDTWLEKFANTPQGAAYEVRCFANLFDD